MDSLRARRGRPARWVTGISEANSLGNFVRQVTPRQCMDPCPRLELNREVDAGDTAVSLDRLPKDDDSSNNRCVAAVDDPEPFQKVDGSAERGAHCNEQNSQRGQGHRWIHLALVGDDRHKIQNRSV